MTTRFNQPGRPSVLIVGHGSSVSKEAERSARDHADTLLQTGDYSDVLVHFLASEAPPPVLPKGTVFLFPFFMSDGYFVKTKISEDFGLEDYERHIPGLDIYQCKALGSDPALSNILSAMADEFCKTHSYDSKEVDVILLSHGSSQSSASKVTTKRQASLLKATGRYGDVSSAFLEEEPSFQDFMKRRLMAHRPVVILGFFAAEGPHAMIDVPKEFEKWQTQNREGEGGSDDVIHYAGVVGVRAEVADLIQKSITQRQMDLQG